MNSEIPEDVNGLKSAGVGHPEKRKVPARTWAIILVISIAFILILVNLPLNQMGTPSYVESLPAAGENFVTISRAEITESASYYYYNSSGVQVKFFLVEGNDGRLHLAADACDVCYSAKRGYHQSGDEMRCGNCGQTFLINNIGTSNMGGGCWPSYIPMNANSEDITIWISDLNAKRFLFE